MAEVGYERLPPAARRDALEVAERECGQRTYLLEKDTWVVATLRVLFEAPFGRHLVFKGGTSLSKVTGVFVSINDHLVGGGDAERLMATLASEFETSLDRSGQIVDHIMSLSQSRG